MKLIYSNDYHGTSTTVLAQPSAHRPDTVLYVSKRAAHRAWRDLCGIDGCTCGGPLGQRGRNSAGDANWPTQELPDGNVEITRPYLSKRAT